MQSSEQWYLSGQAGGACTGSNTVCVFDGAGEDGRGHYPREVVKGAR